MGHVSGGRVTVTDNPHTYIYTQSTSENRAVRFSNGHFSDSFCIRISDAKNKMAAITGSHLVKTIRKPDKKVQFSDGRNKMATI
jgi:hypothetical protein